MFIYLRMITNHLDVPRAKVSAHSSAHVPNKQTFSSPSPEVGAHIQPGIKVLLDEENLSAGTEACPQGLGTLKETSSFSAGLHDFTVSLWAAHCRALHNWLHPAFCTLDHLGCSCSACSLPLQAAAPFVPAWCSPRPGPVTPLFSTRCRPTLCPAATREPGATYQVLTGGSAG